MFCPSFTWQADLHGEFVPLRQTRRLAASIVYRSIDRFALRIAKIEQFDPRAIGKPVGRTLSPIVFRHRSRFNYKNKSMRRKKIVRRKNSSRHQSRRSQERAFRRAKTSKLELLRLSREYLQRSHFNIARTHGENESFFEQRPRSKLDRRSAVVGKVRGTNRFRADPPRYSKISRDRQHL